MGSPPKAKARAPLPPDTPLEKAFEIYLQRRQLQLKPSSIANYELHFRFLLRFLGAETKLSSLHEGHFREYQTWRSTDEPGRKKVGPSSINHELNALSQVLALADLWHPIDKYYERLPNRVTEPPRVLTEAEEERFFRFAARQPRWRTACYASLLTANTTILGCELRAIRLEHIRLEHDPPMIQVTEPVKNRHRVRGVPLNALAVKAVEELLKVAREHGAMQPKHYLIPYRVRRGKYDPQKPASRTFIRSAFRTIARLSGLEWVTPRSFRHQAITKLLEGGAPEETVRAIAGHVSEKSMHRYSHVRIEAKKRAVDVLVPEPVGLRNGKTTSKKNVFPMVATVQEHARRLGIPVEAALELVLAYERSKGTG
jgi:integrase